MNALRLIRGGRDDRSSAPAQQDGGWLRQLYEAHAGAVYARCRYLLRDDEAAKDALQDVFAKALQSRFRGEAQGSTWLLSIATNHCLNELRSRRAKWRDELQALRKDARHEVEGPDRRELLRALLGVAEPEAQEVAVMTYVDEMTQAEIAQALGRSLPTVRKRLREFLVAARSALAQACPELQLPLQATEDEP